MFHYHSSYEFSLEESRINTLWHSSNSLSEIKQLLLQNPKFLGVWINVWYNFRDSEDFVKMWLECYPHRPQNFYHDELSKVDDFSHVDGNFPEYFGTISFVDIIREILGRPKLLSPQVFKVVTFSEKYSGSPREFFLLKGDEENLKLITNPRLISHFRRNHYSFFIEESNMVGYQAIRHQDYFYWVQMVNTRYYDGSYYHFMSESDLEKLVDSERWQVKEVTLTLPPDWKTEDYIFNPVSNTRFYSKDLRIAALPYFYREDFLDELKLVINDDPDEDVRNAALILLQKRHPNDWESVLKDPMGYRLNKS